MSATRSPMNLLAEGWQYEPPEPDVGFFTGQWVHESCTAEYEQGVLEESSLQGEMDERGYVDEFYTLTCHDCGSVTHFIDKTFVGHDEPYDEEGVP